MKFYLSSPYGMEGVVKNEIKKMDVKVVETKKGFVVAESKLSNLALLNMNSRVASRVYIVLNEFVARSFDELYDNIKKTFFEDYIMKNSTVVFHAKSYKSALYSLRDIQKIAKKAYIDRYKHVYSVSSYQDGVKEYSITIKIEKNNVMVLLDTSGESLHKRFWRTESVAAPIRENVAAGLILLSRYFGKGAFIDPMCGSGTFAIEAAMISKNIPPGINRKYAYDSWGLINQKEILFIKNRLTTSIKEELEFPVEGYDIDERAIQISKKNASNLGLKDIVFKQRAVKDFASDYEGATVVTNFPYGQRLLDQEKVKMLELAFNKNILAKDTWGIHILTANDRYPYTENRRATKIRKFLNGHIETYFYEFPAIKRW